MGKAIAAKAVTPDLADQVPGARVVGCGSLARSSAVSCSRTLLPERGPVWVRAPYGAAMIPLETLLLFVPLAALLVVLPGPDFALIAKISLCDGRPQGQAAACGVAVGICLHTTAAMLGISALLPNPSFGSAFSSMWARPTSSG